MKIAIVAGIMPSLTLIGFFILSLDNNIWKDVLVLSSQQGNKFYIVFWFTAFLIVIGQEYWPKKIESGQLF